MKKNDRIILGFNKALKSYDNAAVVQKEIISILVQQIPSNLYQPSKCFEFGSGTGLLAKAIEKKINIKEWHINDLSPDFLKQHPFKEYPNSYFYIGDAKFVTPFNKTEYFDLIVSSSTIQWMDKPFDYIINLKKCLAKNGLLLLSTFGERNLFELKTITNKGLYYPSFSDWELFLNKHFSNIQIFEKNITIKFSSIFDIFRHLKATGVTLIPNNSASFLTKASILEAEKKYRQLFALNDNMLPLTYNAIFIIAYKK